MLFNLFVKESAIQYERAQSIYSILVIEAESVEEAAQSLAIEIGVPDERGRATVVSPEARFRLHLTEMGDEMWLAPIIRDQPGTLSQALDWMRVEDPLVLSREEWLEELQSQTEYAAEAADRKANIAPTSEAEFAEIWLNEVGECGTPEMQKALIWLDA